MTGMDAIGCQHRWYDPTPAWLVYGAAAATGVLFASERWRWFFFNEHKGWTVLIAVALVGGVFLLLLAWLLLALLFRRRFQFGLRTLIVFVTLCALVCSWFVVRLHEARRQAKVVLAIRETIRGSVEYDWEYDNKESFLPVAISPVPAPLRNLLGDDFFGDVKGTVLRGQAAMAAVLPSLAALPRLRYLYLGGDGENLPKRECYKSRN